MASLTVALGQRAYHIHIGAEGLDQLGHQLGPLMLGRKATIVTNPTVGALYLQRTQTTLTESGYDVTVCEIPDGESYKSMEWLAHIHDHLLVERLGRKDFIVALGGGVIGDLAGFAAATYLRGIPFVQVPTTVVAQVDSSVGGKTGVNHARGKNLIGAFYQPLMVTMDMSLLTTLPTRELIAGLAEVVKYGMIYDRKLFNLLVASVEPLLALEPEVWGQVVRRCCEIKAEVVAADERETSGLRAILNYGHTVGHVVEAVTGYGTYKHGEAVAIGMSVAARMAVKQGRMPADDAHKQDALLTALGLPTSLPDGLKRGPFLDALSLDKKADGATIKMVLCTGIGQVELVPLTPDDIISQVLAT